MPEMIVRKWDGPYSFMVFREYGVYKARRGDTGEVQFEDPSKSVVIQNAANTLLQGGTIFLREVQLPSGLTIPTNVLIVEDYQGVKSFYTSRDVYPPAVEPYGYIVFEDNGIFKAKNGQTGKIDFDGIDADSVINDAVNELTRGSILLKGELDFSDSVITKPGVPIRGEGVDTTIINAPSGKPAFKYEQPAGSTSVVWFPLILRDLTINIPTVGGPHYGIKVNCSAYGGARALIDRVGLVGSYADGTYDKDSATPHVGVEFVKCWDWYINQFNCGMPGVVFKTTSYGTVENSYLNGGQYGKAIGVLVTGTNVYVMLRRLVTEVDCRPVVKGTASGFKPRIKDCHFEGEGWDTATPEPVIEYAYSPTWEFEMALMRSGFPAMQLNGTYKTPETFLKHDRDILHHLWAGSYSTVSGSPTVSVSGMDITVDNSGGGTDALVLLEITDRYALSEICFGGYLSGQGEVQAGNSTTFYCGLGINVTGDLYVHMLRSGDIDETVTITSSGTGAFWVLPINIFNDTKKIVYDDSNVYYSAKAVFSAGFPTWGIHGIWISVPAGETLTYKPLIWRG